MNILIGMRYANPPAGGAEKSLLILSKMLKSEGHNVKILSLGYENKKSSISNIPLEEISFRNKIKKKSLVLKEVEKYKLLEKNDFMIIKKVQEFNPDLIITQHEISFLFEMHSKNLPPIVLFIHGMEFFPKLRNRLSNQSLLEKFYSIIYGRFLEHKLKRIIKCSSHVFFPSKFLKEKYSKYFKGNFCILPPFTELEQNHFKNKTRKYILHIKPTKVKGIKQTLDIARNMPKENFLICGKNLENLKFNLPNVKYIGHKKNMNSIYDKSKILLIPTTQPETFSISSVEAQWRGCNVLALKEGGIPAPKESFLKTNNINRWINAIKKGGFKLNKKELLKYNSFKSLNTFKKEVKI